MHLHVVDLLRGVLDLVPDQVAAIVCLNSGILSIHQPVVLFVQFFFGVLFVLLKLFNQKSLFRRFGLELDQLLRV